MRKLTMHNFTNSSPLSPCTQGERGWGEGVRAPREQLISLPLTLAPLPRLQGRGEQEGTLVSVRSAFTLVELLVVIAIIAVLAALTAVGVSKVVGNQRSSNTQNAMRTIQKVLNEHWAYVVAEAKKETGLDVPYTAINTVFGPDTSGGDRNRIIWIKMRLMEAFPVSYAEIKKPFPYVNNIISPNLQKYNGTYLKTLGKKNNDNFGGATESSACLLMTLSITRNGTALNIDNLGSTNVADTDTDGLPELIDGWGNALTFFRFPTNNQALQDSSPNAGAVPNYADPVDPGGALFLWKGPGPACLQERCPQDRVTL